MRSSRVLLQVVLSFVPCVLAGAIHAQVDLCGPLARRVGSFHDFKVSPDGMRVVYASEEEVYGLAEIFSAPADGSAPTIKISAAVPGGEYGWDGILFTPDSSHVVYALDDPGELMCAPADGSSPAIHLADISCAYCDDSDFAFMITTDGSHVLYRDRQQYDRPLYSVPVDGSGPAVQISLGAQYPPVSDGTTVAYLEYVAGQAHLFRRPIDASAPAQRLDLGLLYSVGSPLLAPDGQVVFLGDDEPDWEGGHTLFAVPLDGSASPRMLNGALGRGRVLDFALADGGARVVYRADALADGREELFVVPLDGSSAPRRLSHALATGADVLAYELSADGTRAVYTAREGGITQLWSARVDRTQRAVRLNGTLVAGGNVQAFELAEPPGGGARVVYQADAHVDGRPELYSVPLDGSLRPHALQGGVPRVTRLHVVSASWQVTFDGEHVLCRSSATDLLCVPVRGGPPVSLNPGGGTPMPYASTRDRAVFLVSDHDFALLSVPLAGGAATRLNAGLAFGPEQGTVRSYTSTPDGKHVVYVADQNRLGETDLFVVPTDGSDVPRLLDGPGSRALDPVLTSDGTRVLHLADPDHDDRWELYVAPLDASAPAWSLGSGYISSLGHSVIDAHDARAVYLRPDPVESVWFNLFSVPLDASAPPVGLSGTLVARGSVTDLALAPDATRVAFRADAVLDERFELWSSPIEGGARVRLSPELGPGGDVGPFLVTPDSERVVFLADARVNDQPELYSAPLVGGVPAIELDPAVTGSGPVQAFCVTPDSTRVVFVGASKLWSVPVDGSRTPLRLDGPLVAGGGVSAEGPWIAAQLGRVLYLADQEIDGLVELWSVPLDGSTPAVRVSDPLGGGARGDSLSLTPDGRHVLYLERTGSILTLAPVLGGGPWLALSETSSGAFELDPFGFRALYLDSDMLFLTTTDAVMAPRRIDVDAVPDQRVVDLGFTPDGGFALWLNETPGGYAMNDVRHLWSRRLPREPRPFPTRPPGP